VPLHPEGLRNWNCGYQGYGEWFLRHVPTVQRGIAKLWGYVWHIW
jgi:hypothetical protein